MSNTPPVKGVQFETAIAVWSQANDQVFQTSVTLADGDIIIIKDFGTPANIASLPVEIGSTGVLKLTISASEMNADLITLKGHDAAGAEWKDWLLNVSTSQQTLDSIGVTVWGYTPRTLTQSGAQVQSAVQGDKLTLYRGDTITIPLEGLGDLSDRSKLWFSFKQNADDTDAESLIQIEETDQLLYLNGAEAATPSQGTMTVTDEVAGDLTITLAAAAAASLVPLKIGGWDVQILDSAGVRTLRDGIGQIRADVTRATS